MPNNDYILRSDALKAILGVSIYDTIEELEGARTIAESTWADGLWDAYKIIEEEVDAADVEPKQRWIPVTERLPKEPGEYIVAYHPCYWDVVGPSVKVGIDNFRGKTTWAKNKYQRVIAWQEKPEPPKGEENDP